MRILSLMSGTSVDGIDVAIADVTGHPAGALQLALVHAQTAPWPAPERAAIFAAFTEPSPAATWCRLNMTVAETLARAALDGLTRAGMAPGEIDLIASHGQTLWHDVAPDGKVAGTWQTGDPAIIAARTGVTTVGNFRVADVAAGGQGAPLTSTFDWYLLRPPVNLNGVDGGWRAVQNIGGMANVTLLPPWGMEQPPLAFDTGPGNALIDWAAGQATSGRLSYDAEGQLAAAGQVDEALLRDWLGHPYFGQSPPKTTGRELFSRMLGEQWWQQATQRGINPVDIVATFTELTAASIAAAYARFAPGPIAQVVVGGGGARNPHLMARLRHCLEQALGRPVEVCTHDALGIDADAKEALAFALLGYLAIHGWPGNVPACTGATEPVVLGEIAPGRNYAQLLRMIAANIQVYVGGAAPFTHIHR